MKRVTLESKKIYGLKVRTTNENEMDPKKAKIGALWGDFFQQILPGVPEGSKGYGVYANYESDAFGAFDVLAGTEVENKDLESIEIEAGNYLCFETKGELPQAVIDTWGEIWNYFSDEKCQDKRIFRSDFELYLSQDKAEIYIGVA